MAKWCVTFDLELDEGHPERWLPSTVNDCLEDGEKAENWRFEQMIDRPAKKENDDE